MILERFQEWSRTADASSRADGVRVLARAVLHTDLGAARQDAITVLTGFLDDPSPVVRLALAEAVCSAAQAPHHIVRSLADDQPAIAAIVLGRSPVLADAELIDCAATASPIAQAAIAARPDLSVAVAVALADAAALPALVALAGNPTAPLDSAAIRTLVRRGGGDAALQEALLRRGGMPADIRVTLVGTASAALAELVVSRGWMSVERMERVAAEARDRATVAIGGETAAGERIALAAHLRDAGQLTVGLAFRVLLSGGLDLFRAMLAELTGIGEQRVDALLRNCGSMQFAALYRDAGLPAELLPAFRAAVRAAAEIGGGERQGLSLLAVRQVIAACESLADGRHDSLLAALRRFEAEAARDEARVWSEAAALRRAPRAEPLLLEPDAREERRPASRDRRLRYTIDLAAIEAELCAA